MSDYMFMLESHLNSYQNRVLEIVKSAAAELNLPLFLTGGAVRDMVGGFPIRDLDFTVEGDALLLAGLLADRSDAQLLSIDSVRHLAELAFPGPVQVEIGMARHEIYPRSGARPEVKPASIHEDLCGRDFSINALALSLNKASRGLLLDPANGLGDLAARELRAIHSHSLADRPIRLFRLLRLQARLGFQIAARTQSLYEASRKARQNRRLAPRVLLRELRHIAAEPNPVELLESLAREHLLEAFAPALSGGKLNLTAFSRLVKAKSLVPFGVDLHTDEFALFMNLLVEKLTPPERSGLLQSLGLPDAEAGRWQRLDAGVRTLEKKLLRDNLVRPSHVFAVLAQAPGEHVLGLLAKSTSRLAQDRVRNYLQKYLPASQEVSDQEVEQAGGASGSARYAKVKAELIRRRLDARPKRPAPEAVAVPAPAAALAVGGRK